MSKGGHLWSSLSLPQGAASRNASRNELGTRRRQEGLVSGGFSRKHAQWGIEKDLNGAQYPQRPEKKGVGLGPEVLKLLELG